MRLALSHQLMRWNHRAVGQRPDNALRCNCRPVCCFARCLLGIERDPVDDAIVPLVLPPSTASYKRDQC